MTISKQQLQFVKCLLPHRPGVLYRRYLEIFITAHIGKYYYPRFCIEVAFWSETPWLWSWYFCTFFFFLLLFNFPARRTPLYHHRFPGQRVEGSGKMPEAECLGWVKRIPRSMGRAPILLWVLKTSERKKHHSPKSQLMKADLHI